MRYKGNINSSYLLCPETFKFHEYNWCKENFDLSKLNRLTLDSRIGDPEGKVDVNEVRVLYKRNAYTYRNYREKFKKKSTDQELKEQRDKIEEYAKAVGRSFVLMNLIYIAEN